VFPERLIDWWCRAGCGEGAGVVECGWQEEEGKEAIDARHAKQKRSAKLQASGE